MGAFLRARHAKTGLSLQFLDFTSGKVSGISALSLALPKNGIHAIFGLYVFALQKRIHLLQPASCRPGCILNQCGFA
jgi:hypothetical protein